MAENYTLAESFHRANIQDRVYYVMADTDLTTLKEKEHLVFGDKVLSLASKKVFVMGNDNQFYEI